MDIALPSVSISQESSSCVEIDVNATKSGWQSSSDSSTRRNVLLRICMIFKVRFGKVDAKLLELARRAELTLYSRAYSMEEYCNSKTLRVRLHALITNLQVDRRATKVEQMCALDVVARGRELKRARVSAVGGDQSQPQSKKRRLVQSPAPRKCPQLLAHADITSAICTFLAPKDMMQLAATCRLANEEIPSMVTNLEISTSQALQMNAGIRALFLERFSKLQSLVVSGKNDTCHVGEEFPFVEQNFVCRSLLHTLRSTNLPYLQSVAFRSAYRDCSRDLITREIMLSLMNPMRFPKLKHLELSKNAIGDDGAEFIAGLIDSPAWSGFVMDLTGNFIGERGMQSLNTALKCAKVEVNLGQNMG